MQSASNFRRGKGLAVEGRLFLRPIPATGANNDGPKCGLKAGIDTFRIHNSVFIGSCGRRQAHIWAEIGITEYRECQSSSKLRALL